VLLLHKSLLTASRSLLVNAGPSYRKDLVSLKIPILLLSHSSRLTAIIIREKRKSDNANSIKRMNYDNYERCIVERHGFALLGWLDNLCPIQNPSRIGSQEPLEQLLDVLVKKGCHWIRLTSVQLEKCIADNCVRQDWGEAIYKPRKKKSKVIVEEDDVIDGAIGNENGDDTDHADDGNQADGHIGDNEESNT